MFHPLSDEHLLQIIDLLLAELNAQLLLNLNVHVDVSLEVKEWLIREKSAL